MSKTKDNICPTCGNHRRIPGDRLPKTQRIPPTPFEDLQVGQGFLIDITSPKDESALRQRMWRYKQKNPNVVLSLKKVDDKTMTLTRNKDEGFYDGEAPPWDDPWADPFADID